MTTENVLTPTAVERPDTRTIPIGPRGWRRLAWLGPAFIWMTCAAGSGEVILTPRIGAMYGYALLWALLLGVILKWFINHEIGRLAVTTGVPTLSAYSRLPGPGKWAVWVIVLPQLVVATAANAGMASATASVVASILPGSVTLWTIVLALVSVGVVLHGRYKALEWISMIFGFALAAGAIAGAAVVFPGLKTLGAGVVPQIPPDLQTREILPWLGFLMAGAAGMMWYSYWLTARGYGVVGAGEPIDPRTLDDRGRGEVRAWVRQMTLDNTVAVVGTVIPTLCFLILGVELLRPAGLIPEGDKGMADTLGHLLGGIWGRLGYWLMIGGVLVAFAGTVISNVDGFGRLLADGVGILLRHNGARGRWVESRPLECFFVIVFGAVLPIALFLWIGKPVGILQLAASIEAAHIPVVAILTLLAGRHLLPKDLRPSWPMLIGTVVAAIFFAGFATLFVLQQMGVALGK